MERAMPEASEYTPRIVNHALVPEVGSYEVDPRHTFVIFSAQHLVVGRVRGRFGAVSGTITIADDPSTSTIEDKVDSASVNTLVAMRDDDLRSEHYLNVRS
jgi:polyisoprenoid-binding protein YceI